MYCIHLSYSRWLKQRLIAPLVIFLLFLPFATLAAEKISIKEVHDIYRSERESIEKYGFFEAGDLIFLRGEIVWDQEDFSSDEDIAKDMTLLEAQGQLTKIIFLHTKWPDSISEDLRGSLKGVYLRIKEVKLRVGKFIQVDSGNIEKNGKLISFNVIAIPPKEVNFQRVSYENLIEALNKAFNKSDQRLISSTYLEICPQVKIKSVIDFMARQSEAQHGKTFATVLLGQDLQKPASSLVKGISFSKSELRSFSRKQLFKVLKLMPYDPEVCYLIGQNFHEAGFQRNAELFFLRGTKWESKTHYNSLCYQSINNEPFKSWRNNVKNANANLRIRIRKQLSDSNFSFNTLSLSIIKNLGNLPTKNALATSSEFQQGNAVFFSDPPDLNAAFELYVKALEKTFSAAISNMIGRCLQLQGEVLLAIPFYMQAIKLNPKHPYAGANLAVCLFEVGEKEQAKTLAQSVLKNTELSNWGRKQIETLEF